MTPKLVRIEKNDIMVPAFFLEKKENNFGEIGTCMKKNSQKFLNGLRIGLFNYLTLI